MDTDRVEGKAKETEGEIQQKWGEAKDKARDTWEDVKDKVEDVVDRGEDRVDELDERRARSASKSGPRASGSASRLDGEGRDPSDPSPRDARERTTHASGARLGIRNRLGSGGAGSPGSGGIGVGGPGSADALTCSCCSRARGRQAETALLAARRSRTSARSSWVRRGGRRLAPRKSSSVRPSRYASITAGLTYDSRATAAVLPSSSPTDRMTAAIVRFASRSSSAGPRRASSDAASSVPPQVRKSFAVKPSPMCSPRYSLSCRRVSATSSPSRS